MDKKAKEDDTKKETTKDVEKKDIEKKDVAVQPKKTKFTKKQKLSIGVLMLGMATLIGGVVFLLLNIMRPPAIRDADFLVEVGSWQLENNPSVIWTFSEIGKGKLTTNGNKNSYDFIWSLEDKVLKIETAWLYTINNEYTYKLNQGSKILSLTNDSDNYNFIAASSVDAEVTENN
jgi:hypothetical protein